ncbi:transporter substrate-binding domain-containing protein (plasmid) [Paracoccus sp. Arc7-R13]|uniref:transporter substrate-binding domain-containing protein n=1 Tax=Paracoccus sp. Arc7-R13 TaxID=2500532 RepID=UPI000FDA51F1|nr:transporter substrate-binding domain-containing protein [Paracoccus sp. Arc7-R13]AZY96038.1 transporter substrate-binding domain-containing protein [Paracoccus sp. Arc7-R13]
MLRTILTATALATILATSALADVIPALHDALPQTYKDNGIKAAVFNDWAPDEFLDSDGQLKGWSVDIAKEMETRLGVPFTFEGTSFDAIIPGLMSRRFDAGFASFGTTPERLQAIDFVAQRKIGTAFAYPMDSDLDIRAPGDVCGLTVAVLNGSWDLDLLEKLNAADCKDDPVVLQMHGTQAQAELAVRSRRAQATVTGSVKLAYMAKQTGDLKVSDLVLAPVNSCIGVRKDDPLGQVMADTIQSMIDDGTYREIMAKWGLDDAGMLTAGLLITEEHPDL